GIQIEGVMHICFLYVKANDEVPFETWQGMVPFSYLMESNETCKELRYDITNSLEQLSVTLLGSNEVEVKAVLAFHSFLRKPVQTKVITNVTTEPYSMEEIEKRPGIIGYLVKEGDELWDLAKRYCTTVEGIMDINGLTEADVKEGERILIFKENMSIL
ncbi:MAG: LysM peptidoglycan-binding domain-containing protein, partial [Lachnospiraceae bacterium]